MSVVTVLGGGISGLSSAYYLTKSSLPVFRKINLLESTSRLGGWVSTLRHEDGSLFERGPRSIRGVGRAGFNTLELADQLGLANNILPIPHGHAAAKNRFIYIKGKLVSLPNSLKAMVVPTAPFSKPMMMYGMAEPFKRRSQEDDESVDSFFMRRFGRDIAQYAANPLCRGVFAGDSKKLSMRSCFPIFYDLENKYGSIILGTILRPRDKAVPESKLIDKFRSEKWAMWSLTEGLQQLPEALGNHLLKPDKNVDIQLETTCKSIEFIGNKAKLLLNNNQVMTVDHVISSLPSYVTSGLLERQHPKLSALLNSIVFASVAVVNIQYRSNVLNMQGFGHLIPSFEIPGIMGVLYESCIFPQHNGPDKSTRITVMMGGAWFEESFGDVDKCNAEAIGELAVRTVADHLNIHEPPFRVIPHVHKCIPQYRIGHHKVVDQVNDYISKNKLPLTLCGASYQGVSVNDCIYNARVGVEQLVARQASN